MHTCSLSHRSNQAQPIVAAGLYGPTKQPLLLAQKALLFPPNASRLLAQTASLFPQNQSLPLAFMGLFRTKQPLLLAQKAFLFPPNASLRVNRLIIRYQQ
jgi:hypothetical protein